MLLTDEKIKDIANETLFNLLPADELILFARAIEAAMLEAQGKQKPVAWMGRNGEDFSYKQSEYFSVPLYAAPVVQPGMVIVPREATPEMVSAGYSKITMEIENSSRDISDVYRAMIAAAEGKK